MDIGHPRSADARFDKFKLELISPDGFLGSYVHIIQLCHTTNLILPFNVDGEP